MKEPMNTINQIRYTIEPQSKLFLFSLSVSARYFKKAKANKAKVVTTKKDSIIIVSISKYYTSSNKSAINPILRHQNANESNKKGADGLAPEINLMSLSPKKNLGLRAETGIPCVLHIR
jgi:hypothetical protein